MPKFSLNKVLPAVNKVLPAVAVMLLLGQPIPSKAQPSGSSDLPALTVFVRHADRAPDPPDDPPLSAAGVKRAGDLSAALHDMKFSAIITTQYIRTRETARPIASALGITPEIVPNNPGQAEAHIKAVEGAVRKHRGETLLVVEHSDTLPAILAALGVPRLGPICVSVYDDLFVLAPASGSLQFLHSRYGVPTPAGPECRSMPMAR
jgi:phosphohistidine phosphatase SixA